MPITKEQVVESIKQVFDPEIPVNIYDLGLIYDIDAGENEINITMSLTTEHCPSAQQIPDQVKAKVQSDSGINNVNVRIVWEPAWTPELISPEGRKLLRLDD